MCSFSLLFFFPESESERERVCVCVVSRTLPKKVDDGWKKVETRAGVHWQNPVRRLPRIYLPAILTVHHHRAGTAGMISLQLLWSPTHILLLLFFPIPGQRTEEAFIPVSSRFRQISATSFPWRCHFSTVPSMFSSRPVERAVLGMPFPHRLSHSPPVSYHYLTCDWPFRSCKSSSRDALLWGHGGQMHAEGSSASIRIFSANSAFAVASVKFRV